MRAEVCHIYLLSFLYIGIWSRLISLYSFALNLYECFILPQSIVFLHFVPFPVSDL